MRRVAGQDRERGSVSVFVLGLIVVLMAVAGLVVDGGRAVNARAEIMDDAEQAARSGANEIDAVSLRLTGRVALNHVDAPQAARSYLVARGYEPGRIVTTVDDAQVTVSVSDDVPTVLLSLIFIPSLEVAGSAVARAAVGITDEITPPGAP